MRVEKLVQLCAQEEKENGLGQKEQVSPTVMFTIIKYPFHSLRPHGTYYLLSLGRHPKFQLIPIKFQCPNQRG